LYANARAVGKVVAARRLNTVNLGDVLLRITRLVVQVQPRDRASSCRSFACSSRCVHADCLRHKAGSLWGGLIQDEGWGAGGIEEVVADDLEVLT